MAENGGDKTEAPTPRRRTEAREQGQIARSHDLTAAILILASMMLLNGFGPHLVTALRSLLTELLSPGSLADTRTGPATDAALRAVFLIAGAIAPLLVAMAVIAILANLAQVGLNFNPQRLSFNLGALNPMRGLKKLLGGSRGFARLALDILKILLLGAVGYSAIHDRLAQIVMVQQLAFMQIFLLGADVVYSIGIRIGIALLLLAIIDYTYQRWQLEQELKMSKQEVKDEMRSMEGDPKVKQRRRQIAIQNATQKLKKEVPKADVVVTNPTEFAVALKYDQNSMQAPRVIAKGQGYMAQRIREIAIGAGVPILERKPLARALFKLVEVGQEIPEQFYSAVAEILAYVYELTGKARLRKVS